MEIIVLGFVGWRKTVQIYHPTLGGSIRRGLKFQLALEFFPETIIRRYKNIGLD